MATSNGISHMLNMISPLTQLITIDHLINRSSLHFLRTSSNPKPIIRLRANSTPKAKVILEDWETLSAGNTHLPESARSIHIIFRLQRKCFFGDQILLVGGDPALGKWNPIRAVPLRWTEGHIWTAELNFPVDRAIPYKFIQRDADGLIQWQPGSNRVFRTWEADQNNTLIITEDWEDDEMQKITT